MTRAGEADHRRRAARAASRSAQRLMAEDKIDAIMLAGGTSLIYFTGIRWGNSERLFAVRHPGEGRAVLRLPGVRGRSRARAARARPVRATADVRDLAGGREPVRAGRHGPEGSRHRVGPARHRGDVEVRVRRQHRQRGAGAARSSARTPVTAGCRMIKDAHELELMRLACAGDAEGATRRCSRRSRPGMTQNDVGGLIGAGYSAPRLPRLRQRAGRRVHRAAARLDHAADDPRRHDHHDRRRLHGRGLSVGHHAHVRARQGDRQDEEGVRHRPPGAERRAEGGAARACRSSRSTPPRAR